MVKAKTKEEFERAWNSTVDQLYGLCHSLPTTEAVEFLKLLPVLKKYVRIASKETYGDVK